MQANSVHFSINKCKFNNLGGGRKRQNSRRETIQTDLEIRLCRQPSISFECHTEVTNANVTLGSKIKKHNNSSSRELFFFFSIFDIDATAIGISNTFWSLKAVDNAGSDQMSFYPSLQLWPSGTSREDYKHTQYFPFMCILQHPITSSSVRL